MSYMNDNTDPFGIPYVSTDKTKEMLVKDDKEGYWFENGIIFSNNKPLHSWEVVELLTNLTDENEQLKQEKEELLDKILECQKALSRKKIREEPHWHRYRHHEGYTAKSDLDIRF